MVDKILEFMGNYPTQSAFIVACFVIGLGFIMQIFNGVKELYSGSSRAQSDLTSEMLKRMDTYIAAMVENSRETSRYTAALNETLQGLKDTLQAVHGDVLITKQLASDINTVTPQRLSAITQDIQDSVKSRRAFQTYMKQKIELQNAQLLKQSTQLKKLVEVFKLVYEEIKLTKKAT